ncbi:MAG: hypothetical protein KKD35_03045 [Elusimicrobia bacterium]|nr:hypothetical protein [Elusimicrobiota bacterium]
MEEIKKITEVSKVKKTGKKGKKGKAKPYDKALELAKGAKLAASSFDKTQEVIVITKNLVTVGGEPGTVEISGLATGRKDTSMAGTMRLWLSTFRYKRPDNTVDHVAGWSIALGLKPNQTALQTAKTYVAHINSQTRPYKAKMTGTENKATVSIFFKLSGKKGSGRSKKSR